MSETAFETLSLTRDARGVATLELRRPDVHNAFDRTMIRELRAAVDELSRDAGLRVAVLTGTGPSFSAGGDLNWFRDTAAADRADRVAGSRALAGMLRALDELPCPLVGRINGQAFGGGVGLISVCDIAVGADTARFGLTEVCLGLIPANISPFVVRRIGSRNARRVMLSGRRFDAAEALEIGLLDRVVPADTLDAAVEEEIAALLRAAPGAAAETKRLIRYVASHGIEDCLTYTADRLADAWETAEGREGIASFLEKRRPSWRGPGEDGSS